MTWHGTAGRVRATLVIGLAALLFYGCSDLSVDSPADPTFRAGGPPPDIPAAIAAQERHNEALLQRAGVVGTAVGLTADGEATIRVFLARPGVAGIPQALDGVPVSTTVSGPFYAIADPSTRARPAPLGFSVGHPDITAGTLGARVVDGAGNTYILSNNHVLANANAGSVGDPIFQPGPFDGGTPADQVATLAAFKQIKFTSRARNTMDAAIALTDPTQVGNATPVDAYGVPSATVYGDANGDGMFDNRNALLTVAVQKYGRTTQLTAASITGINATVTVCYEAFIFCTKAARFIDRLIVGSPGFSDGGDSGSLIVAGDGTNRPIGLLFAGSATETIANRIDLVLAEFGVAIDDGGDPPPATTDLAVSAVSVPASVTAGNTVDVTVTVSNVGSQDVPGSVDVMLFDDTDAVAIGTRTVAGLGAGTSADVVFSWNTVGSTFGGHSLTGSHDLADDNAGNDTRSASVTVLDPDAPAGAHVGDLDAFPSNDGSTWSAVVEVLVHDGQHNPVNGATVVGVWTPAGLASDTCTTGELGGNGTCIFLYPSIRKRTGSVTFTVTSVSPSDGPYLANLNHDDDGSSDGTVIVVLKP